MDDTTVQDRLGALRAETLRIEEDTLHSAKGHFAAADGWRRVHLVLGIPAAVGAGVAGVSALQSHTTFAGVVAFVVAAMTAITTFLNPSERTDSHRRAGNGYLALRNRTRIFRTTRLPFEHDANALQKSLEELSNQRDKMNATSLQIPHWAYVVAKRRIDSGEATYAVGVDDESAGS